MLRNLSIKAEVSDICAISLLNKNEIVKPENSVSNSDSVVASVKDQAPIKENSILPIESIYIQEVSALFLSLLST